MLPLASNHHAPQHTVYARWREHATLLSPGTNLPTLVHCYEAITTPIDTPPAYDTSVRLVALTPRVYRRQREIPPNKEFSTYDPIVEGRVVGVRVFEGEAIEMVVENEKRRNKVAFVHITLAYGNAASRSEPEAIRNHAHWVFDQMPTDPWPASNENGVKIYDETPTSSVPEGPFRFPDPLSSYATIVEALWGPRPPKRDRKAVCTCRYGPGRK